LERPLVFRLYEVAATGTPLETIKPSTPGKLLLSKQADAGQMINNEWFVLDTVPIADSAGKTYMLRIETENPDSGASFSPWAMRGQPFPLLGLYYGNRQIEQSSLCLRTTCLTDSGNALRSQ
jgi:hypothetical protein